MTGDLALLALATVIAVAGVALIATAGRRTEAVERTPRRLEPGSATGLGIGVTAGLVVFGFSGWVLPAVIVGVAAFASVRSWQRRDRRVGDVEFTDALATWIENLRDVLIAGEQPVGAVGATVSTCPPPIRPAVRRLAASLGRQDPDLALRRFADDLDDPLGDLIAAGLLIAIQRGARTVPVLDALARQARQQADRRRVLDAERAPIRREVTLLSVIMGALIVGLFVFGRADYLAAYDTAGGQAFLAIVLAIYAVLLLRVQRLARFPQPARFLTSAGSPTVRGAVTASAPSPASTAIPAATIPAAPTVTR